MKFLGDCIGVELSDRSSTDAHQCVTVLVEDDDTWFKKLTISSFWLEEMIEQLQAANAYLKANAQKEPDGYGYRRKP